MTDPYGQQGGTNGGVPPQQPGQNPYPGQPPQGQNPYAGQPGAQGPNPYAGQAPQGQNPYPQGPDPYGQAQPGAQGQNPYAQNPYAAAGGAAPAQPSTGAKAAGIGLGILKTVLGRVIVAVVVLAVVFVIYFVVKPGAAGAKVGDCLSITGTSSDPDAKIVKCTDSKATYLVTAVGGTCDENEDSFTFTVKGATTSKLCLYYNVQVGDCLKAGTGSQLDTKGTCAKGEFKVNYVSSETSDDSKCPADTTGSLPNVTRNRLICVVQVK